MTLINIFNNLYIGYTTIHVYTKPLINIISVLYDLYYFLLNIVF